MCSLLVKKKNVFFVRVRVRVRVTVRVRVRVRVRVWVIFFCVLC